MRRVILQEPDERLAKVCLELEDPPLAKELVDDLIDSMGPRDLGLAAPQLGAPVRVFVAKLPDLRACINPKWTPCGAKRPGLEKCLSVAGSQKVFRHISIDAQWTDLDNSLHQRRLVGLEAVLFQHECDHLDGITINRRWPHE